MHKYNGLFLCNLTYVQTMPCDDMMILKGGDMMPATKAEMAATNRYKKKNYKRVVVELRFEQYEKLKSVCDGMGLPVGTFAKQAILESVGRAEQEEQKIAELGFSIAERAELTQN